MAKKGLIITLITLGLVVVLPVVAVFGCLYVNDKTTVQVDEDFDIKKYGQYIASSSLDEVNNEESESYGKLDFAIDQLALNSLINAAVYKKNNSTSEESEEETTQDIKDQITKYVPSMYVLIKENEYVFKINAKFGFFKTQVALYTKLSKTVNETNPRDSYFEFEITNFTLGRIPKVDSLAKKLLSTFNLQDTVQGALNDYGIHAEVDLANASIKYTYGNLLVDIQKLATTLVDDANIQLYFDVIDEFVESFRFIEIKI